MNREANFRSVVKTARMTDVPPDGADIETYGDARRDAILWAHDEIDRLTEREGQLREASACPPDSDLVSWVRMLADAWCKQQAGGGK